MRIKLGLLFSVLPCLVWAGAVKFTTFTEKKNYYDFEPVYLTYKIENADYKGVEMPQFDDFEMVRHSVSSSSSHSITIINGKRVSKGGNTYEVLFELKPKRNGVLRIPVAKMSYEGKTYTAPSFTVEVKGLDVSQKEATKDRFVKVEVSNPNPYVGQGFTITYTLFTVDQITEANQIKNAGTFQNFGPFTAKEVGKMTSSKASINGKNYQLVQLQKHLLVPIKGGKVKIPGYNLNYVSYQYFRESWFSSRREEKEHQVKIPSVTLNVKGLPAPPPNFSGLVGSFSVSRKVDKQELQVNDALTVRYEIKGQGNFSSWKENPLKWGSSWEVFDPKLVEKYKPLGSTYQGKLELEYVAIPRENGVQKIPGVSWSYFDLKTKKYRELKVGSGEVTVKGEQEVGGGNVVYNGNKQKVEVQANDIRYLTNDFRFVDLGNDPFFGSSLHHALSLTLGATGLFFLFFFNPKQKDEQQLIHQRKKGAYKKAQKVLKSAQLALNASDQEFYGAIEPAMNNYFMEKYNLAPQNFNRESLKDALFAQGISLAKTEEILKLQEKCGMARYSPIGVDKKQVYEQVKEMIAFLG